MEIKDKIIATLRKQLKDAASWCNALEQENALWYTNLKRRGRNVLHHAKDR